MNNAVREMTLKEWCDLLIPEHRVNKELRDIIDIKEFEEWLKENEKRFHTGQFSENEKMYSAYLFGKTKRFAEGYKKGQESIKRKNKSGCCCVIDDDGKVIKVCGAHAEWFEEESDKK